MSSEYEDDFINSYQVTSRRSVSKPKPEYQSQTSLTYQSQKESDMNRSTRSEASENSSDALTIEHSIKKSIKQTTISSKHPGKNTLKELSPKELKAKLIQAMKDKGILDHMKAIRYN